MTTIAPVRNRLSSSLAMQSQLENREMLAVDFVDTDTYKANSFENGIDPFVSGNSPREQPIVYASNQYAPYFKESEYEVNGSGRGWRGLELKLGAEAENIGYVGYWMKIPSTDASYPFPDDKNTIVHQWYNWSEQGSNWASHLAIDDNDLVLTYRGDGGTSNLKTRTIAEDLPRDEWIKMEGRIYRGVGSTGGIRWEMNDELLVNVRDSVGWGNEEQSDGTFHEGVVGTKMGMYTHETGDYTPGEERHLLYDDMSALDNDGWAYSHATASAMVDPSR